MPKWLASVEHFLASGEAISLLAKGIGGPVLLLAREFLRRPSQVILPRASAIVARSRLAAALMQESQNTSDYLYWQRRR